VSLFWSQLLRRRLPYDGDALRLPFDASLALGSTTFAGAVRGLSALTAEVLSTPDTVSGVSDPTTGVQTCYRHDDRRAGVRCQRCGRAICPDCMHQASVGFHCPECVKEGGQRVVTARSLAAGSTHYVTTTLIALNVAVYVISTIVGAGSSIGGAPSFQFELDWALIGAGNTALGPIGVAEGEWYRLVTSGFLHGGLLHLGFNMFALWILGRQLEPALGRANFAAIYFSSLLAGSLGVLFLDPNQLTLGASGAVFGLFGYALVAQWARGINPMDTGLGGIILINLVFTFAVPGISIGGHLGGLVGGALAGALMDVVRPRIDAPAWVGTLFVAVLGVGCAVVSIAIGNGL
jgi:membrane associated rhomboid family serine protease